MRPARNALNQIAPRYLVTSEDPKANAPKTEKIIYSNTLSQHSRSTLTAL